ncbi:MAG: MBL fold metallo-hydrolase [Deltaproteobacteria bacterium]|nr:MBL fold metallo-hydrolase [Deltaproteobacteria bacterium]
MNAKSLYSVEGNRQRLDGGAMFGNAPRAVWSQWIAPDEQGRIPLACRALLCVEESGRTILFETGVGAFFEPRLRDRFGVTEEAHVLLENLAALGHPHESIDVVVLSHLHFDHAGGLLAKHEQGREPSLLFPRASFVIGREAWERARAPHLRDRASFIPELPALLEESGRLSLVDGEASELLGRGYRLTFSLGHTPGLMLTEVPTADGPLCFAGDLIPGAPWVHLPITMGYDRFPERLIEEKQALLERLLEREGRLFFTHDPEVAVGTVTRDERGRFSVKDTAGELRVEASA